MKGKHPQEKNTVLEAIHNKIGKQNVNYVEGCSFDKDINTNKAVANARNSDVVVLCLGEPTYCETPGSIFDLTLNKAQLDLAERIAETGKPVVLIMLEGRPRLITSIEPKIEGIVLGFLPGMEGGNAMFFSEIIIPMENCRLLIPNTQMELHFMITNLSKNLMAMITTHCGPLVMD